MPITQAELGQRIAQARMRRGVSQNDLGEASGLSQSAISRIESGERAIDSLELAELARHLRVSVLDLLQETPLPDELLSLSARVEELRAPGALDLARNRLFDLVRFARTLDELGIPPEEVPSPSPLAKQRGTAIQQGQKLAEHARSELGLGRGPLPNLFDDIEQLGLDLALEPLPDGLAGLCVRAGDLAIALVDSTPVLGRQRFTAAHELAHFLAGDAQPFWIDEQLFGRSRRNQLEEMRANAFAAHFLMPPDGLERHVRGRRPIDGRALAELQHTFGVSLDALLWHLQNLKVISDHQRRTWSQTGAKSLALRHGYRSEWMKAEAFRGQVRPPSRLLRRALTAYTQGLIGVERLADLLREDDIEALRRELEDAGISPEEAWIDDTAPA